MGVDDGPADRQPHPESAGLGGVESVENVLAAFRINAGPGISYRYDHTPRLGLLGADRQLSWTPLNQVHRFDRIQDQIQDDLLQLNAIPLDGKKILRKRRRHCNSMLGDCASRQNKHLTDCFIEVKTLLSRRRFSDVIAYPIDDLTSAIRIPHNAAKRFPDLVQVGGLLDQEIEGGAGVVARSGDRL